MITIKLKIFTIIITLFSTYTLHAIGEEKQKPNVSASSEIRIEASIEQVWHTLAIDFGGIGKWASGVLHSEGSGSAIDGASCSERACKINAVGFSDTREKITLFDEQNHTLRYDLYDGLPGFVKDAENAWHLEAVDGGTLVRAQTDIRATGFLGWMMRGMMKSNTRKVLDKMCEELKYYVERGKPHPRKLEVMAKVEKKKLFVLEYTVEAPVEELWKVIAVDFDRIADSHPVCPKSEYIDGYREAGLGARRVMYMKENLKKYFKDEITAFRPEVHELSVDVIEAKGYPVKFARVEFNATALDEKQTHLQLVFSYQTKPRFLQGLAKSGLKKQLQNYLYAIDYHTRTGEVVNKDNWKQIRKQYKKL